MEFALLIISLLVIVKASDILVDASVSIAERLKVPKILIALTIMAFSTCAPELAVSFTSIANGNGTIAFANVIGSCIVNILLVIGVAAVINPIRVKDSTIKKELPLLMLITLAFSTTLLEGISSPSHYGIFSRSRGLLFVLLFSLFVIYIIQLVKQRHKVEGEIVAKYSMKKAIIYFILSIVAIIISSDLLVDNAILIAEQIGISQKLITMVVIVIGTSLPELVMTSLAARKNEHEMAIGNIIGTNIFNICIVLGLPITLLGDINIVGFNVIDIFFVAIAAVLLFFFANNGRRVSRREGIVMIGVFITYYTYLFLS